MTTSEDLFRVKEAIRTSNKTLCGELRALLVEFEAACEANVDIYKIRGLKTKINIICYSLDHGESK